MGRPLRPGSPEVKVLGDGEVIVPLLSDQPGGRAKSRCSGLRLSGTGPEIIAIFGPDCLRRQLVLAQSRNVLYHVAALAVCEQEPELQAAQRAGNGRAAGAASKDRPIVQG